MAEKTKNYQLKLLFSDKENFQEIVERIKRKIIEQNGSVSENNPVRQRFGYPIKKQSEGFFQTVSFALAPGSIKEIKNYLSSENGILRSMIVAKKTTKAKPTPMEKIDLKMIDKIEPAIEPVKEIVRPKKEKVKIEELDKKLKEILGQ